MQSKFKLKKIILKFSDDTVNLDRTENELRSVDYINFYKVLHEILDNKVLFKDK